MKLPTYLTTVTPLSKGVALFLFFLLPILGFTLGLNFGYYSNELDTKKESTAEIQLLKQQLADQNEEINTIINDRGVFVKEFDTTYTDTEFGLYSPLFKDKKTHVNVYKYKRTLITRREIQLNDNTYAITWTYELVSPNTLPGLVIFDGYENYGLYPFKIADFQTDWDKEKPYSSNNRLLHWKYIKAFRSNYISSVFLEGMLPNTAEEKPVFFRLVRNVEGDHEVDTAKKELQKIADQIPYRKTN